MNLSVSSSDMQRLQEKFAISDTTGLTESLSRISSPNMAEAVDLVCRYFFCQKPQTVLPIVVQWVSMMLTYREGDSWEKRVVQWIRHAGNELDISKPKDAARVLLGIWPQMENENSSMAMGCICKLNEARIGWTKDDLKCFEIAQGCKSGSKLNQAVDALIALDQAKIFIDDREKPLEALLAIEESRVQQIVGWVIKLNEASRLQLPVNWGKLFEVLSKFNNAELDRAIRVKADLIKGGVWIHDEPELLRVILECKNGSKLNQGVDALIKLYQGGVPVYYGDKQLEALLAVEEPRVQQIVDWVVKLNNVVGRGPFGLLGRLPFEVHWSELIKVLSEFNNAELDRAIRVKADLIKGRVWIHDEPKFLRAILKCKSGFKLRQAIDALITMDKNNVLIQFGRTETSILDGGKPFEALLALEEKSITQIVEGVIKLNKASRFQLPVNWGKLFEVLSEFNNAELDRVAELKLKLKTVDLFPRLELEFLELFQQHKNGFKLDRAIDALITLTQGGVDIHNAGNLLKALLALEEKSLTQIVEEVITKHKENSRCSENDWRELFQSLQG